MTESTAITVNLPIDPMADVFFVHEIFSHFHQSIRSRTRFTVSEFFEKYQYCRLWYCRPAAGEMIIGSVRGQLKAFRRFLNWRNFGGDRMSRRRQEIRMKWQWANPGLLLFELSLPFSHCQSINRRGVRQKKNSWMDSTWSDQPYSPQALLTHCRSNEVAVVTRKIPS